MEATTANFRRRLRQVNAVSKSRISIPSAEEVRVLDSRSDGQGFITCADPPWFISSLRHCLLLELVAHAAGSRWCRVLSLLRAVHPPTSTIKTPRDPREQTCRGEETRRAEDRGRTRRRTTSHPSTAGMVSPWRYRVRKRIPPRCSFVPSPPLAPLNHPLSLSLPTRVLPPARARPVPYGAENCGPVDSVFPLAEPGRRNFRKGVIRG